MEPVSPEYVEPRELHLFDFDGTLFRSPSPPPWWEGKSWWVSPASLGPPCVPREPGLDWWNEEVLDEALNSTRDPEVLAVLLTGRNYNLGGYRWRVPKLLSQVGLDFDIVKLNPKGGSSESTLNFKADEIAHLLELHPSIKFFRIWEDREEHLRVISELVSNLRIPVDQTLVESTSHPVACGPQDFASEDP
jgi:hypothetical protein